MYSCHIYILLFQKLLYHHIISMLVLVLVNEKKTCVTIKHKNQIMENISWYQNCSICKVVQTFTKNGIKTSR